MAERRRKGGAEAKKAGEAATDKKAAPLIADDVGVLGVLQGRAQGNNPKADEDLPIPIIMWVILALMLAGFAYAMIEMLPSSMEHFVEGYKLWKDGNLQ